MSGVPRIQRQVSLRSVGVAAWLVCLGFLLFGILEFARVDARLGSISAPEVCDRPLTAMRVAYAALGTRLAFEGVLLANAVVLFVGLAEWLRARGRRPGKEGRDP